MTNRLLKNAIAGTILTLAFTACVHRHAGAEIDQNIYYENHQNNVYSFSYPIAREEMKEVYAPALKNGAPDDNPLLGIADVDLNGDRIDEIIARPIDDDMSEDGLYCTQNLMCPHYILQVRNKKIHRLGIIFADTIMLGKNVTNGYWDLLVYKNRNQDASKAETYSYDKAKGQYVPKAVAGAKP